LKAEGIHDAVRNDWMSDGPDPLVARAKAGDRAALNALLERHLATVYRFVSLKMGPSHPDLDDIVQEALIGASRSIRGLRGETNAEVAGWLLSITRHKVADHLRGAYSHPHESLEAPVAQALADPEPRVEDLVTSRDRADQLRGVLHELTPDQEEVLTLRFVLGFSLNQVAEITHRPVGAVKSMQHRALASLRQRLGPDEVAWS
jgi:RNA polymerase sigma-70 factor (ECF subfamily)